MHRDLAKLFKVRLGFFVVMSAVLGWFMATDVMDLRTFLMLLFGGYALTGASNGFNQILERDVDALMKRTSDRPLPAGRMTVRQALSWSLAATVVGLGCLFSLNPLSGWLGVAALVSYAFVYTPLKAKTSLAVFVGAFPGALPPMIGYVAATGDFGIEPGTLFAVQFMWQFPHFWAIAWLAHDDYLKAGYELLPFSAGRSARSAQLILLYTLFCIPASMLPWALNQPMVGDVAFAMGIAAGCGFSWFAWRLLQRQTLDAARHLMFASFVYLPLVQIVYVLDKMPLP
ncbi:MAG: heme o synthase [Bacteroidetes bacterium]|nr:heme o synthase [Bacteroidota bacterium]MDA0904142.1 heme o synthase [Bacteroidota bacterium]MDA1242666.1 heme o synthase [Bacteroidota bacterium]